MGSVLLKAGSFVFIIILGYVLKLVGFFDRDSYRIPMKIVLNITLPAAIIANFSLSEVGSGMLLYVLLGFGLNWVMLGAAYLLSRKKNVPLRAAWLNAIPGYNVGAFVIPFVQAFLPAEGVVTCCLFDAGSALMCTGGTYAVSCGILGQNGMTVREIAKRLLTSVPFLSYTGMLIFTMLGFRMPDAVLTFAAPIGNANSFLAMLMVGLMLDIRFPAEIRREIVNMTIVRVIGAAGLSALCILLIPGITGKAAALCAMGPVSIASTALAEKAGADADVVACVNSLTILISVAMLTAMILMITSAA